MRISIFGLGYVGTVTAACLSQDGHEVIGVDTYEPKVRLINEGKTPVIEAEVEQLIARNVAEGRLRATLSPEEAVAQSELSMVCVGTPSNGNGSLDLRYVTAACNQIGEALRGRDAFHTVAIRSTMLPGSMHGTVIPMLEQGSGKRAGEGFGVCNNPEFLREGTAVRDYLNPPKTVIGETDSRSGDALAALYSHLRAPMIRTDVATAEMVKYTDNVWHALKVGFANEVGNICKALSIDGRKVMEIFCQDQKLNISPAYMKPGFAFGGSCLPKDLRALTYHATRLDVEIPILKAILPSNAHQIEQGVRLATAPGCKRIGVLGLSFKEGTDDLRESPMVEVVERLIGKGYDVRIYDRNVRIASLVGANRDYILNAIPHISQLMLDDMGSVVDHGEVLLIGNNDEEFQQLPALLRGHHHVIDLARCITDGNCLGCTYEGICW